MIEREDILNALYDKHLPNVYRANDEPYLYLKRYLQALCEGGYDEAAKDINGVLSLITPSSTLTAFLPSYLRSVGLPYFPDIPPVYQRRILAQFGELYRRRGSMSGVSYLAKVLTGMECELEYHRGLKDVGTGEDVYGRWLDVNILAVTVDQVTNLDINRRVVERYLRWFVPYYINVWVTATIALQEIHIDMFTLGAVSQTATYNLRWE